MPTRAVMDTNVLYAGLRSKRGASFQLLEALWSRRWTLVLSQTVLTEYEEVLKREASVLNLTLQQIDRLLDALCALAERRILSETWHAVLTDPDDEALVHLAVESQTGHLVSHNIRHLEPARALGVNLVAPRAFLAIIRHEND
ncbi:MAG: putative toxin-antitoxin system toxin component, PIN family [Verrucomicrobia bacterium]|nr:putative toxin-antitoxin system toxin component, PIN family [Verrucomicrobiota bacterium]